MTRRGRLRPDPREDISLQPPTADTDGSQTDTDDQPEATSRDDLATTADAQTFDETFQVSSSEIAFASGESPAVPRPWQGIPRVAVVYNLNYVYDPDQDRWIKKTPSEPTRDTDTISTLDGSGQVGDPGVIGFPTPTLDVGFSLDETARIDFPQPSVSTAFV